MKKGKFDVVSLVVGAAIGGIFTFFGDVAFQTYQDRQKERDAIASVYTQFRSFQSAEYLQWHEFLSWVLNMNIDEVKKLITVDNCSKLNSQKESLSKINVGYQLKNGTKVSKGHLTFSPDVYIRDLEESKERAGYLPEEIREDVRFFLYDAIRFLSGYETQTFPNLYELASSNCGLMKAAESRLDQLTILTDRLAKLQ